MDDKATIYGYLKASKYMTLATATKSGKPEAATVEYVVDGDTLLINTYTYYRKYRNLVDNPLFAGVVTADSETTLQFEGTIQELSADDADKAKSKMLEAEPGYANFYNDKDTRFFRLTPSWMRLRDYTKTPLKTTEYKS